MAELITISGNSGAGKTTIAQLLAEAHPSFLFISFDDHEDKVTFPSTYPGAMPEEYDLSLLAEFVRGEKAKDFDAIFFDYPFGRMNGTLDHLIDFAVFLDVPLDISMARRTRRVLRRKEDPEWLLQQLEHWEEGARDFCVKWEENVANSCDLTINAAASPESIVKDIRQALTRRL